MRRVVLHLVALLLACVILANPQGDDANDEPEEEETKAPNNPPKPSDVTPPFGDDVVTTPPSGGGATTTLSSGSDATTTSPSGGGAITTKPPTRDVATTTIPSGGDPTTTSPSQGDAMTTASPFGGTSTKTTPPAEGDTPPIIPTHPAFNPPASTEEDVVPETDSGESTALTNITKTDETFNELDPDSFVAKFHYSFDIWLVLMETLNFSVEFVFPISAINEPASLKNLVLDGTADMVFSSIPMLYSNDSTDVQYTAAVDTEKVKLFIQSPTSETSFSSLGNVFRPFLWFMILLAIALMAATLIFIEHMGYNAKLGTYLLAPADTGQLVITILGNFCYQGAIEIASGCAGRVVIFSSLMCGYLVYVSYSTLVISQLTAVKPSLPFETIEEMALRKDYKLKIKNDVGLLADIEVSRQKKSAMADVWNALLPKKLSPDSDTYRIDVEAIKSLCQDKNAILTFDQKVSTQLMKKANCSATPLRQIYFRSHKGYAINPNFKHRDLILRSLTRLRETGILHRWRRYWNTVYGLNQEAEKEATVVKPISLDTMYPLFGILVVGMIVSIIILIVEIIYKKLHRVHQKRMRDKQFRMFHKKAPIPFVN